VTTNDDAVDVKAIYLRLGYDDAFVTPVTVIKGPDLQPPSNYILYHNLYSDSIIINIAALVGDFDGPGRVAGVIIHGGGSTVSTTIAIDSSVLRNPSNQSIPHTTTGTTLQIDCNLPMITVSSPPSGGIYNALPTLQIALHDAYGLNRGYFQIDGCAGPWHELWGYNSGAADTSISWTVPLLAQGQHIIYFRVADDAGNINADSCTYWWSFTFDADRPIVAVVAPPSGGLYFDLPTLTIHFNDNLGLNCGFYQIDNCSETWLPFWQYNCGVFDTTINWMTPPVSAGFHQIFLQVTDDNGNTNSNPCTYSWGFTYRPLMCGDVNGDDAVNVGDPVFLINYIFKGGPAPNPPSAGDINCDGGTNVGDAVYLINFIFKGGPEPCCL
jgi:hypothetical protein